MVPVVDVLWSLLWVHPVACWCFCFYVCFASSEGLKWFDARQNPFLIGGAAAGIVGVAAGFDVPPAAQFIVCCGWSLYAMLVTVQHFRFQMWRKHILPVNVPLAALLVMNYWHFA